MKSVYRITCPLCGSLKYSKNFSKDNAINRVLIQSFLGRRKMKYSECMDVGIKLKFQRFIIERLERIYYRLTGIDIRELILTSNQSLITKIIPSSIPIAIHAPIDTAIHAPIDTALHAPIDIAIHPSIANIAVKPAMVKVIE